MDKKGVLDLIILAKKNDNEAICYLIEKFDLLIKKYARQFQPMSVDASTHSFVRKSDTNAKVTVKGYPSGATPFIKLKITLQSAALNSSTYSNVSGVTPDEYTVYDAGYIYRTCNFAVTTNKNYRVKIEITDKVNGQQITKTYYCKLA